MSGYLTAEFVLITVCDQRQRDFGRCAALCTCLYAIVFLKRKFGAQQLYKKLDTLVDEDILFPDEVNLLRSYNNNLAESIWTWIAHIVADLNEKGKIKGEVRNDEKTLCTKSP